MFCSQKVPKAKELAKTRYFVKRKGKAKEQKAIFTIYCGVVNIISGTNPVLGGGEERPDWDPQQDLPTCVKDRSQWRRLSLDNATLLSAEVHFKWDKNRPSSFIIHYLCTRAIQRIVQNWSWAANQSSGTTNHKKERDFEGGREYRQGESHRQRLLKYEGSSKEPGTNRSDFGRYGGYADISGDTQSEVGEWLVWPFTFVLSFCTNFVHNIYATHVTIAQLYQLISGIIVYFVLWETLGFILSKVCFDMYYMTPND